MTRGPAMPTIDRFMQYVDRREDDQCWPWIGGQNGRGYGLFWIDGMRQGAHRAGWRLMRGEVPDGLELDHLCRNRACVNPRHLEVVDHQTNVSRALNHYSRRMAAKTECPKGHPLDGRDKAGRRYCMECARVRSLARYHAKKASA